MALLAAPSVPYVFVVGMMVSAVEMEVRDSVMFREKKVRITKYQWKKN